MGGFCVPGKPACLPLFYALGVGTRGLCRWYERVRVQVCSFGTGSILSSSVSVSKSWTLSDRRLGHEGPLCLSVPLDRCKQSWFGSVCLVLLRDKTAAARTRRKPSDAYSLEWVRFACR